MPARDTCIVFLTHVWDAGVARRFERLKSESAPHADCFLLLQDDDSRIVDIWKTRLESIGATDAMLTFNSADLPRRLGLRYFGAQRILANTHFPLLMFRRSHPDYAYYWQLEGDVEYRGRWGDFFAPYGGTDAALLASHIHRWADWPDWFWWPSLTAPVDTTLQTDQLFKAFMAVARFSRASLDVIEKAHHQ